MASCNELSQVNPVAEHYNKKNNNDLATRAQSRIYYLRNFNNWIKSVLINEFINKLKSENNCKNVSVLDLGSGKGGDMLKWKRANVSRVTFLDIAEKSLEECKNRYENPIKANFEANFIHLDASKKLIKDKLESKLLVHNLVSCQFVIHYSFESYEQANTFLKNVSDSLEPGGYFIGTTTNSNELIKRLRKSEDNSFGNSIYNIKFHLNDKENIPLFGVKFDFQLEGVVECPEYLVNFDAFVKLAKKHNLKLYFKKSFSDFYNENVEKIEYKNLITIIKALEPISIEKLSQINDTSENEFNYIKNLLDTDESLKEKLGNNETYATLSQSEWEAITLYLTYAFVKV